jgi:hypothetical protein
MFVVIDSQHCSLKPHPRRTAQRRADCACVASAAALAVNSMVQSKVDRTCQCAAEHTLLVLLYTVLTRRTRAIYDCQYAVRQHNLLPQMP